MAITDFLNSSFTQPTPNIPSNLIEPGYVSSMLDVLKKQCSLQQTVASNSILDATQMENDPNFNRANPINQTNLLAGISKLGISTQTLTATQGLSSMSSVAEILPPAMRSTLMNYISLGSSAGSKTLQTPNTLTQTSNWQTALTKDLNYLFGTTLSFSQIAGMAATVLGTLLVAPQVTNSGTANTLPLSVQQAAPADVADVVQSTELQTTLSNTSLTSSQITSFNQYLTTQLSSFGNTIISNLVTASNYQNVPLTMEDPLGINARTQLQTELQNSYNTFLTNTVKNSGFFTSQTDINNVVAVLIADATANLNAGFSGKFALPALNQVVNAVKVENKNFVIQAFSNAFDSLSSTIILQAGLNQPTDTNIKPVDYLQNVKKNLEARIALQQTGGTQAQFNTYDSFLKTVIANGDISPAALNQLNNQLNSLLKETVEVC